MIKMAQRRSTRWGRRHQAVHAPQLPAPFSAGGPVGVSSLLSRARRTGRAGPGAEGIPYAIRQVSGGSPDQQVDLDEIGIARRPLALLNAGVPLRAPWWPASLMNMVSNDIQVEERSTALWSVASSTSDILGAEDAFGDMDFRSPGPGRHLDTK